MILAELIYNIAKKSGKCISVRYRAIRTYNKEIIPRIKKVILKDSCDTGLLEYS